MKASAPVNDDISRVLEGVVMDLKRIPPTFVKRLEVHYDDGEVAEVGTERIADILKEAEDDGVVYAIELDLDLDLLSDAVDTMLSRSSEIIRQAAAKRTPDQSK